MIDYGAPLLYHGGEDEQRSFILPAGSSGGSSTRRLVTLAVTHKFPRRGKKRAPFGTRLHNRAEEQSQNVIFATSCMERELLGKKFLNCPNEELAGSRKFLPTVV